MKITEKKRNIRKYTKSESRKEAKRTKSLNLRCQETMKNTEKAYKLKYKK